MKEDIYQEISPTNYHDYDYETSSFSTITTARSNSILGANNIPRSFSFSSNQLSNYRDNISDSASYKLPPNNNMKRSSSDNNQMEYPNQNYPNHQNNFFANLPEQRSAVNNSTKSVSMNDFLQALKSPEVRQKLELDASMLGSYYNPKSPSASLSSIHDSNIYIQYSTEKNINNLNKYPIVNNYREQFNTSEVISNKKEVTFNGLNTSTHSFDLPVMKGNSKLINALRKKKEMERKELEVIDTSPQNQIPMEKEKPQEPRMMPDVFPPSRHILQTAKDEERNKIIMKRNKRSNISPSRGVITYKPHTYTKPLISEMFEDEPNDLLQPMNGRISKENLIKNSEYDPMDHVTQQIKEIQISPFNSSTSTQNLQYRSPVVSSNNSHQGSSIMPQPDNPFNHHRNILSHTIHLPSAMPNSNESASSRGTPKGFVPPTSTASSDSDLPMNSIQLEDLASFDLNPLIFENPDGNTPEPMTDINSIASLSPKNNNPNGLLMNTSSLSRQSPLPPHSNLSNISQARPAPHSTFIPPAIIRKAFHLKDPFDQGLHDAQLQIINQTKLINSTSQEVAKLQHFLLTPPIDSTVRISFDRIQKMKATQNSIKNEMKVKEQIDDAVMDAVSTALKDTIPSETLDKLQKEVRLIREKLKLNEKEHLRSVKALQDEIDRLKGENEQLKNNSTNVETTDTLVTGNPNDDKDSNEIPTIIMDSVIDNHLGSGFQSSPIQSPSDRGLTLLRRDSSERSNSTMDPTAAHMPRLKSHSLASPRTIFDSVSRDAFDNNLEPNFPPPDELLTAIHVDENDKSEIKDGHYVVPSRRLRNRRRYSDPICDITPSLDDLDATMAKNTINVKEKFLIKKHQNKVDRRPHAFFQEDENKYHHYYDHDDDANDEGDHEEEGLDDSFHNIDLEHSNDLQEEEEDDELNGTSNTWNSIKSHWSAQSDDLPSFVVNDSNPQPNDTAKINISTKVRKVIPTPPVFEVTSLDDSMQLMPSPKIAKIDASLSPINRSFSVDDVVNYQILKSNKAKTKHYSRWKRSRIIAFIIQLEEKIDAQADEIKELKDFILDH